MRPEPENPLERRLLAIIAAAGLPAPECQRWLLGRRRDLVFAEQRLIVEVDGARGHLNPAAFEADRRREAHALAHGCRTVCFTRDAVFEDPAYVTAALRELLTAAGTLT